MKVLVSGSTGLVGSTLVPFLTSEGHSITRLVRAKKASNGPQVEWDPVTGAVDKALLEGYDAVVHLAGDNIASGRWTAEKKATIRDSRVNGTRFLCQALAGLESPPGVLVSASAIGYYGNRGDELLTETSGPGQAFLSDVCLKWEAATEAAAQKGIRVVSLRIGVVLSTKGGALSKMLPPFQLGMGGVIGSGRQYMSWIAVDDVAGVIHHVLANEQLSGPVNAVAPNPVTSSEFTRALGKVLSRPTIFPVPEFACRLAFGEMADEILLASTRVEAGKLKVSGYSFRYPEIEGALRHLLGRS